MALKQWITNLIGNKEEQRYRQSFDYEGANFLRDESQFALIQQGKADDLITYQHVLLRMLLEEGEGRELPNGFCIPSNVVVSLDENARDILELPKLWAGAIKTDIKGVTGKSSFRVDLQANFSNNSFTSAYRIDGPTIRFSEENRFLLSPVQLSLFEALNKHSESAHTEFDNLSVIAALQSAQRQGIAIELGHFETLKIHTPESISIEAELDAAGNLILTPNMGQDASHEDIQRVLGQIQNRAASSLRVKDEIILLDEEKMAGVKEVLKNRVVKKEQLEAFYRNPTAFIDASFVNLEIGFSARVRGAIHFRHAYFGETDESGIDWFGKAFSPVTVNAISKLADAIQDEEQLHAFEELEEQAKQTSAQEVEFEGKVYDISDAEQVETVKNKIRNSWTSPLPEEGADEIEAPDESHLEADSSIVVVDIALNDEDLDTPSEVVEGKLADVLAPVESLSWSNYLREPLPHQIYGVRWLLGLATDERGLGGGLLADDMGLGKTFMSLAAIEHLSKRWEAEGQTVKPCLIVAPLSLLQNWKDEVSKTFVTSPFRDIVILQSDGELKNFRLGGSETQNQSIDDDEAAIRYSLKIGSEFNHERLDMPKRLVITTYQTLRDYQFSLCAIDWGVVAFDEAQNIKNPNALQTRAAKGLKAEFRLLVTGTPVENSLADFWCVMDTACPGFLGSYQSFREEYVTPIVRAAGDEIEDVRARIGRSLRNKVGALMLRRLKEDNLERLPQKRLFVGIEDSEWEYLDTLSSFMKGEQLKAYESVLSGVVESEENTALAGLHQLRDVSLHHRLLLGGKLDVPGSKPELDTLMLESGKFASLLTLLKDIQSRSEKVIVFCVNKRLQAFLSIALAKYFGLPPLAIINGDTKAVAKKAGSETRKTLIETFEGKEGFNAIIMSPVAAGVGLTVVGANNVIHLERHWNPAKEAQATDRVYRIGQQKNVNVYIPIVRHPELMSFDENLHMLLSNKSLLRDAVVTPEQVTPSPEGFSSGNFDEDKVIGADDIRNLSWQQFEAFVAELFAVEWQVKGCMLTATQDHGADVVLDQGDQITLIQCKHTASAGSYRGYKAVKEVESAERMYKKEFSKPINRLIVVTNATRLSADTGSIAKDYGVEVIDGRTLGPLADKHQIPLGKVTSRLQSKRLNV